MSSGQLEREVWRAEQRGAWQNEPSRAETTGYIFLERGRFSVCLFLQAA